MNTLGPGSSNCAPGRTEKVGLMAVRRFFRVSIELCSDQQVSSALVGPAMLQLIHAICVKISHSMAVGLETRGE